MQFVIKDLVKDFTAETGIECEIIISSSGKLTAQINEGAPFDVEVLSHHQIFEKLKTKLVYGESIAQVNQFVNSQVAEVGFTSKSVVLSPKMKGKGKWVDVDETIYQPIAQGIVCIKNDDDEKENLAVKFSEFLFSAKGKEILNTFGYSTLK